MANDWVGYGLRSATQIFNSIISRLSNPTTGIPEVTDYTDGNPLIKEVRIWSGISEMIGYSIDFKAREGFLTHQRLYKSAWAKAKEVDYRIKGRNPSSGTLRFSLESPASVDIVIPSGTRVETSNGIPAHTTENQTLLSGDLYVDVPSKQHEPSSSTLGVSDGNAHQSFVLSDDVADQSISITVGTTPFKSATTFIDSSSTDNHFVAGLNRDRVMEVAFGDGEFGVIPTTNDTIQAEYMITTGENVAAGRFDTLISSLSLPNGAKLSVSNPFNFVAGSEREGLAELKERIPKHTRVNNRAVTVDDFARFAELVNGVDLAGSEKNCGSTFKVFVYPVGGGTASPVLLQEVKDLLEEKGVLSVVEVYPAGDVVTKYEIDVDVDRNFVSADVEQRVKDALISYHQEIRKVGGSLKLGNIYQQVEGVSGVDNSNVKFIQPIPAPIAKYAGVPQLNWQVDVDLNVVPGTWTIRFDGATTFNLHRDSAFLGSYSINQAITIDGVAFTILQSYTQNDVWDFVTYPAANEINLVEPGVLSTNNQAITLNMIGGI